MVYETERGDEVGVYDADRFWVDVTTDGHASLTREQLTQLRDIIDQALNTSAEELEASGE